MMPHSELPLLPSVLVQGTTKGLDPAEGYAPQEKITTDDQFVRLSDEGYLDGVVAITVASSHLPPYRILVPDLAKSRGAADPKIDPKDPVPPESVLHNSYKGLFDYLRAEDRISALYESVERVQLRITQRGMRQVFSRQINLPFYANDQEAAGWEQLARRVRRPLGIVKNPLKDEAEEELRALGNLHDKNTRCTGLMGFMVQDRLKRRGEEMEKIDVSVTARAAGPIRVLDAVLVFMERIGNVANQALTSRALKSSRTNRVKTNAVGFWRVHAEELKDFVVEPFRTMFQPIAECFTHGADALEQNDSAEVQHWMKRASALCFLFDVRMDVEHVLSPVAEMREIQKRRGAFINPQDEALWNETKMLWVSLELASLLETIARPETSSISPDILLILRYTLVHVHNAITALRGSESLARAYAELKLVATALETSVALQPE